MKKKWPDIFIRQENEQCVTEPSPYLEDTYFGEFASYPKYRFKNDQPLYLHGGIQTLNESELCELDHLAELLTETDKNVEQIEHLRAANEKLFVLTNNTQNIYYDMFG